MVRLKRRYILFELTLTSEDSVADVSAGQLVGVLRAALQKNFGDLGSSHVQTSFSIKYYSKETRMGIISCHREALDMVMAAMFFVTKVDGCDVIWQARGVSGSISKCQQRLIKIDRKYLAEHGAQAGVEKVLDGIFGRSANAGEEEEEE